MKLTVNKNEAKLLEDLTIIEDKKTLAINLLEGTNVQHVKIGYEGTDESTCCNKTFKEILISYNDGEIYFGISNRYGNGYRAVPLSAIETLLWNEDNGMDNMRVLKENKENYKLI